MSSESAVSRLADQMWRLNNLYFIIDKGGKKIPFRPNSAQEKLLEELTLRHLVPKSRQFGISTIMGILQLDFAIFEPGFAGLTLAHDLEAAERLFYRNIKLPYDNLPESIRNMVGCYRDRARELRFTNESMIAVATSGRSGSFQLLHVSEFGKICAKYPERAREIVTGAFEAAGKDQMIVVESTAEGRHGYFYEYCMDAKRAADAGEKRGQLDWRYTFLPWWQHADYILNPAGVKIPASLNRYFQKLKATKGINLTPARMAWYASKAKVLGEDMKREYPSYFEEAFEQSIQGAYYEQEMTRMREEGRICSVPHQPGVRVDTWWDLGMDDATAVTFTQEVGRELHVIDYFEESGEGLAFYAQMLEEKRSKNGWVYGEHIAPHDINVRELGPGMSRRDTAAQLGLNFSTAPKGDLADGIELVRNELGRMWIDETKCERLISALDSYQKEWDDARGCFKQKPLHNWASHAADTIRNGLLGRRYHVRPMAMPVKRTRQWAV